MAKPAVQTHRSRKLSVNYVHVGSNATQCTSFVRYVEQQYEETKQQQHREKLARDASLHETVVALYEEKVSIERERFGEILQEMKEKEHEANIACGDDNGNGSDSGHKPRASIDPHRQQ